MRCCEQFGNFCLVILERIGISRAVVGEIGIDDSAWSGHSRCVGNAARSRRADSPVSLVGDFAASGHRYSVIDIAAATGREP